MNNQASPDVVRFRIGLVSRIACGGAHPEGLPVIGLGDRVHGKGDRAGVFCHLQGSQNDGDLIVFRMRVSPVDGAGILRRTYVGDGPGRRHGDVFTADQARNSHVAVCQGRSVIFL